MIPTGEIQGIQYGICELSDLDEMGTLLAEIFARFDPPPVAMHITPAEFEKFIRCFLPRVETDGLTIVARDAESKQMVGALLTEDAAAPLPSGLDLLSGKFDPIFNLLEQLSVDYWEGQEPSPGEFLHFFLLGVAQPHFGRGIAQNLVTACVENGVQKGYRVGVTEATNSVSQHIFRKAGFVERVQRSYRDYRYQGDAVFASIEGHTGPILMDRQLKATES